MKENTNNDSEKKIGRTNNELAMELIGRLSRLTGGKYSIGSVELCYLPSGERTHYCTLLAGDITTGNRVEVVTVQRSVARLATYLTGLLASKEMQAGHNTSTLTSEEGGAQ